MGLSVSRWSELKGVTASLYEAVRTSDISSIKNLAGLIDPEEMKFIVNERGLKVLEYAVDLSNQESFKALVAAGFNPADRDPNDDSLVMFAHTPAMIDLIVEHGGSVADVMRVGRSGGQAIHYFSASLNSKMLAKVIELGADVNAKDHWGMTPLHIAAKYAKPARVNLLLDSGADPSICDSCGDSALHIAVRAGGDLPSLAHVDQVVRLLLEAGGVDLKQRSGNGKSLLQLAKGNIVLKELIRGYGNSVGVAREIARSMDEVKLDPAPSRRSSGFSL